MDQESLVEQQLSQSRARLMDGLRARGIEVTGATWLRSREDGQWRLIVATPDVSRKGPLAVYQVIQEVIHTMHVPIGLASVGVIRPDDPFVSSVQHDYPATPEAPRVWTVSSGTVTSLSSAVSAMPVDRIIVYPPGGKAA